MKATPKLPKIAIIGGGICGLTTALALEQRGYSPTVYEAASAYRSVGAGLLMQTNALLVYDRLGIADRIQANGVPLDDSQIRSPSGRVLKRFDLNGVERKDFGYGFVAIHRAALQQILLDELDTNVKTGMACASVIDSKFPTVQFEDGTHIQPEVLIGADGINSEVREAVVPNIELQPLDYSVYRGIATLDLPEEHRDLGFEVWGDGTYTGGAPIDSDRFYWFATAPESLNENKGDTTEMVSALKNYYQNYPEPIPAIVDSFGPDDIIVTDLEDLPQLKRWYTDSIVLAGDAAHGMLPFAGQGAAQAIEDALALAHSIDTHDDPTVAFSAYEAERKPRADSIRSESRQLGKLGTMQSTLGAKARNFALRLVPHAVFRRSRRQRASGTTLPEATELD